LTVEGHHVGRDRLQGRCAIGESVRELCQLVQGWALVIRVIDAVSVSVAVAYVVVTPCEDSDGH